MHTAGRMDRNPDDEDELPRAKTVAIASGILGLAAGMACDWQLAIESAQVLAGIVEYPPGNPFYLYHVKAWTLLHQVPALFLRAGVPDSLLSALVGGLVGLLAFQALALVAWIYSRNGWLSVCIPAACYASNACKDASAIYPIRILSDHPWIVYGAIGASLAIVVWCYLAVGMRRAGGLLMGLAPAVHPALGAWCVVVAVAGLFVCRRSDMRCRSWMPWFIAGLTLSIASLLVHWLQARHLPNIDAQTAQSYVRVFAENWDSHRKPFPMDHLLVGVAGTLILSLAALAKVPDVADSQRLLSVILIGSAIVSLVLCVSTLVQDHLPLWYLMAMPGRYIALAGYAFPALALGILAGPRSSAWTKALLAASACHVLLRVVTLEAETLYVPEVPRVLVVAVLLCLAGSRESTGATTTRQWRALFTTAALARLGLVAAAALYLDSQPVLSAGALLGAVAGPWLARQAESRTTIDFQRALTVIGGACLAIAAFVGLRSRMPLPIACAVAGLSACCVLCQSPACLWWQYLRRSRRRILATAAAFMVGTAVIVTALLRGQHLANYNNDPVYAAASKHPGMLLTASRLRAGQLKTRRPVLLEGAALNQLPYVPASGPEMNRILKSVYGDDLFLPRPPGWKTNGGLGVASGRALWERRTVTDWQNIAAEFGVTDVMTYADWKLKLPVVARTTDATLYRIPPLRVADTIGHVKEVR